MWICLSRGFSNSKVVWVKFEEFKELLNRKIEKGEKRLKLNLTYELSLLIKKEIEIYKKVKKWIEEIK